jgi:hypothetical protein
MSRLELIFFELGLLELSFFELSLFELVVCWVGMWTRPTATHWPRRLWYWPTEHCNKQIRKIWLYLDDKEREREKDKESLGKEHSHTILYSRGKDSSKGEWERDRKTDRERTYRSNLALALLQRWLRPHAHRALARQRGSRVTTMWRERTRAVQMRMCSSEGMLRKDAMGQGSARTGLAAHQVRGQMLCKGVDVMVVGMGGRKVDLNSARQAGRGRESERRWREVWQRVERERQRQRQEKTARKRKSGTKRTTETEQERGAPRDTKDKTYKGDRSTERETEVQREKQDSERETETVTERSKKQREEGPG